MGAGNFTVSFSQEYTPTAIIESIKEWGHIVVTPQEVDVDTMSDSDILSASRYTGIVLNRSLEEGLVTVNGQGLELYLGDGAGKGMVIAESNNIGKVRTYTNATLSETLFNSTVQTGKPFGIMRDESGNLQAITQGTISNPAGTYTGQHFVETALSALKFVSEILDTEYRINPNGTIDAGPAANLFVGVGTNEPTSVVVKTAYGEDPEYQGVTPQGLRSEFDASDWVSRVDFTGEVGYFDIATDVAGEANLSSNPYKDLHGNALTRVGLVQEPEAPEAHLNARAQAMLNELSRVKKILNLDLTQYEVSGDMKVGDFVYAFDPDVGFNDTDADAAAESRSKYEIAFRGQTITPAKVRVIGITYPIMDGMGVYYRDLNGNYTDLTDYVNFESGAAQVELGDALRGIKDDLRFNEFSLSRENAGVFSIPDLPATPTLQSGTYLDATGESKGFIRITVAKPTNEDGSQITDGLHYKVRYQKTTDSQYSYMSFPYTGASSETLLLQDLTVGSTYQIGVAVVDKSGFKKMSAYDGTGEDLYTDSSSVNANFATNARVEIEKDGQAPSKPKTGTIAAGPLRVQVTHYLGKDGTDGQGNPFGNFTLEGDVDHLDIHAVTQSGNSQSFTVATSNKIGEIRVTSGNLLQAIPVIATIELEDSEDYYFRIVAVDKSGNSSDPSDGQTASANLIAEANIADATITTAKIGDAQITNAKIADATITSAKIGDLSANKITSGTITGGEIILGTSQNTSGFIKSYNFSSGSAGWAINTDGTAEFANATIRGSLNASDITAGTLNVDRLPTITTSQINFDAGDIGGAESGTILATINASSEGITIDAAKLNLTGVLSVTNPSITSGSVGGITISSSALQSTNYSSGSAGFLIESDGDAFFNSVTVNNPVITLDEAGNTQTPATNLSIAFGSSKVYESTALGGLQLQSSGTAVSIQDRLRITSTGSTSTPSLLFDGASSDPGLYLTNEFSGGTRSELYFSSGANDIFHSRSDSSLLWLDATGIAIGGGSGSSDQYIGKSSNGAFGWHDLPLTTGNYSTNTGALSINNSNSTINISVGNNSNQLSAGHNHPYGTGNGNGNGNSNLTQNNIDFNNHSHSLGNLDDSHNHSSGNLSTGHNHNTTNIVYTNTIFNATNAASNSYVNGQIATHYFSYFAGHNPSDRRYKKDIVGTNLGLDFVNRLQPREFNWTDDYLSDTLPADNEDAQVAKGIMQNTQQGFIVDEIKQAVFDETGSNNAFSGITYEARNKYEQDNYNADDPVGYIRAEDFIPPLVKSVQQLSAKIDVLEARIDELENP